MRLFAAYGLLLMGMAGWASWRGLGYSNVDEGTVSPKSVRDNPGAYRPIYSGYRRYWGGK